MRVTNNQQFLIIFIAVLGMVFVRSYEKLSDWKYTHWLFNYDLEFTKRGFIGEVISSLGVYPSYEMVYIFSYIFLLFFSGIIIYLIYRAYSISGSEIGIRWFALVIISSPAFLQHLHYDVGRFDIILLSILLLLVFLIKRYQGLLAFLLIAFFITISILIHEAAYFIILPFILAYFIYINRSKFSIYVSVVMLLLATILTYQVSTKGKVSTLSLDAHHSYMKSLYGDRPVSPGVLHKTTLEEQFDFVKSRLSIRLLEQTAVMFIILLPLIILLYKVFRTYGWQKIERYDFLVFISTLSPLALLFLGIDYFRWIALSITLFIIFFLLKMNHDSNLRYAVNLVFMENKKTIYLAFIFSALAGPLGITGAFQNSPL